MTVEKDFMISFYKSMWLDRALNLVPLTPQSDTLLTALLGPAFTQSRQ